MTPFQKALVGVLVISMVLATAALALVQVECSAPRSTGNPTDNPFLQDSGRSEPEPKTRHLWESCG